MPNDKISQKNNSRKECTKKNINNAEDADTSKNVSPDSAENSYLIRKDNRISVSGLFEMMDGFGFVRIYGYNQSSDDIFVGLEMIRKFHLKTGDSIIGIAGDKKENDRSRPLIYINSINGREPFKSFSRPVFETLTPVFPTERFELSKTNGNIALRIIDCISPIGKGQRGIIASPPKAGKTTILKSITTGIMEGNPEAYVFVLLIDERPEEVTDFIQTVNSSMVEVVSSTFDETPEHHKRAAELTIERAKRLVEEGSDVVILLDSLTRLVRAYNLTVPSSGKTLSGGIDPASFYTPKKFFGAARNVIDGGSLTIVATALVDTGSRMDDVIYEEFKGTGNMELTLSRKLQELGVFPAIDIAKSGTRRDDLLLSEQERAFSRLIRRENNESYSAALKILSRSF